MTKTKLIWVRLKGHQTPRPGAKLRVQLEQNVDGRPLHPVGYGEGLSGRALLRLIDTKEGRSAAELVREDMIDAVFWGSKPTLRLR